MNKFVLKSGLLSVILIGIISCNKKENELADQRISELESYVDSLKSVSDEDVQANWAVIADQYDIKSSQANDALATLDEKSKTASQVRIDATNTQYQEIKGNAETVAAAKTEEATATANPTQSLRDRLFGAGKIGNDMSFAWVNKNNILTVYENFFQTYKDNKGDFTREDYDEIKLMYEALDNRKNTVEKEGLSGDDNAKISSIKVQFGPMFKVNRVGAKGRETAKAKE